MGIILGVMVFNATFKNISVLSWRSVLLLDETGVTGANVVSKEKVFTVYVATTAFSQNELKVVSGIVLQKEGTYKKKYD
jgi:hypothetical protein